MNSTYKKIKEGEYEKTEVIIQKTIISISDIDKLLENRKTDEKYVANELKRLKDLKKLLLELK